MAEPPESNGNAGNDNPFLQGADAGDGNPPAVLPDTAAAPPAYTEAVQSEWGSDNGRGNMECLSFVARALL